MPQLPDLVAELRRTKTLCEGRARQAKDFISSHHVSERNAREGSRLYTDMKAELDGCIDYLRSGLVRRFNADDSHQLEKRFRTAGTHVSAFFNWVDTLEPPPYATVDASPLEAASKLLSGWLDSVSKANDKAIEQLRDDLNQCRLRDWQELGP